MLVNIPVYAQTQSWLHREDENFQQPFLSFVMLFLSFLH